MKNHAKVLLILGLALGLSPAASLAVPFNFSYTFGDGLLVTGSLDGTENGQFVDNVTNVAVFFNGQAMSGSIYSAQLDAGFNYLAGPIVSFDALQNNFFFINSDVASGNFAYDSFFSIVNASVYADTATAQAFPLGLFGSQDAPTIGASWSLTQAPVPEPGSTFALLVLAFAALIGLAQKNARRAGRSAA